jgi:hypothetical protein
MVGERGWLFLTKDDRIRRRPIELDALIRARLRAFVFESGEMPADTMIDAFRRALPRIVRVVKKYRAPFVWRIATNGRITPLVGGTRKKG